MNQVLSCLLSDQNLTPSQKLILFYFASIEPVVTSMEKLSDSLGLDHSAVRKLISKLKRKGYIIHAHPGRRRGYRLNNIGAQ